MLLAFLHRACKAYNHAANACMHSARQQAQDSMPLGRVGHVPEQRLSWTLSVLVHIMHDSVQLSTAMTPIAWIQ